MRHRQILFVALLVGMLGACASNGSKSDFAQHKRQVNSDYVAAVEQKAKRNNVRVLWVNPPTTTATTTKDVAVASTEAADQ